MTYIFTVKDTSANKVEYLRAENIMRAFDVGQGIIKQGNEILNIVMTGSDDSPVTIDDIRQSLVVNERWAKEYAQAH